MTYPILAYEEPPERSDPDWRRSELSKVISICSEVLAKRNDAEIDQLIKTVNRVLRGAFWKEFHNAEEGPGGAAKLPDPASAVWRITGNVDITQFDSVPKSTLSEYFAAMAIALARRAFWGGEASGVPRFNPGPYLVAQSVKAMEYAQLGSAAPVQPEYRDTISQNLSRGQKRRYQSKTMLYERWRQFYSERCREFKRKNAVAEYFYDRECNDEERQLLTRYAPGTQAAKRNAIANLLRKIRDLPIPTRW